METIKFEDKDFPSVIINLPFGKRRISTIQLNELLMNFDGNYVSEEAKNIDEQIFYFVKEEALYLNENELINLILSEI